MERLLRLIKKEKILFFGITFLLFFIPIYPKFPLFPIKGTYVHIRIEDILVSLLVVLFLIQIFLKKNFGFFKESIFFPFFVFFFSGFLSVLNGIFITKNVVPHLAFLHWLRRVEYISLFFIAYYSLTKIEELKILAKIVWFSTMVVIIYGLGQKFFGWPVVSTMNKEFSKGTILKLTWWARVNSTFAGHYDLAAYLVMVLCLTIALIITLKKRSFKFLALLLGIFSYYLLILTASRISFAAYLIGGLLVLIVAEKKWWIPPFLFFSILGMIFSEDLGQRYAATFNIDLSFLSGKMKVKTEEITLVIPTQPPTPTEIPKVTSIKKEKVVLPTPIFTPTPTPLLEATPSAYFEPTALAVGRSTDIRFKVEWPRAIRAFAKNPLLGTGYSSLGLATDNDYLRMLGETGILGTLAFWAIIFEIARRFLFFLKQKKSLTIEKTIIIGVSGAAIAYFANAMFIDVLEASKVAFFFWIMIGIGVKIMKLSTPVEDKVNI